MSDPEKKRSLAERIKLEQFSYEIGNGPATVLWLGPELYEELGEVDEFNDLEVKVIHDHPRFFLFDGGDGKREPVEALLRNPPRLPKSPTLKIKENMPKKIELPPETFTITITNDEDEPVLSLFIGVADPQKVSRLILKALKKKKKWK